MNSRQRPTELAITHQGSAYSNEQRRDAAVLYTIHGCAARVARDTGIPESTLSGWRKQTWWEALVEEVRSESNALIEAQALKTIHAALEVVNERLDNGDEQIVKIGEEVRHVRRKVSARDAAVVAAIMFDKRQILMRQPPSISGGSQSEELAEQLTAWMRSQKAKLIAGGSTGNN